MPGAMGSTQQHSQRLQMPASKQSECASEYHMHGCCKNRAAFTVFLMIVS